MLELTNSIKKDIPLSRGLEERKGRKGSYLQKNAAKRKK
jgi:hypothetical protein